MEYWVDIDDEPPVLLRFDAALQVADYLDPATGAWVEDLPYLAGLSAGHFEPVTVEDARRLAAEHGWPEAVPGVPRGG